MVMGSERRREGWMMLVVASLGQPSQPSTPGPGLGRYLPLAAPPAQQRSMSPSQLELEHRVAYYS